MTSHPIRILASNLEDKRLPAHREDCDGRLDVCRRDEGTRNRSDGLMAVREAIDEHGPRMGWGSDQELA